MLSYLKFIALLVLINFTISCCNAQNIGFVDVFNDGAFMARVSLTYSLSGRDIIRETGAFPYLKSRSIITPYGATNLRLTIQYLAFIGVWNDIVLNYSLQSTNKCIYVAGNVFKATWSPVDC